MENAKDFSNEWNSLYDIRNKVAHSKPINKKDYDKANKLIEKYTHIFDECIEIIDKLKITTEEAQAVDAVAQQVISQDTKKGIINDNLLFYQFGYSGLDYDNFGNSKQLIIEPKIQSVDGMIFDYNKFPAINEADKFAVGLGVPSHAVASIGKYEDAWNQKWGADYLRNAAESKL